jgi:CMP-N-acetylneuraminic acid synthetase
MNSPKLPEVLAIIPARGGSKGIPRKNVASLCGRPLIGWTIEAALQSETVTRVVVSTDDAEIDIAANRFGAEVIERPDELSGDHASSEAALLHVLETLWVREQYMPQLVVFLQCTSPLTAAEDIDGAVQQLQSDEADTAVAVVPFHFFLWKQNGDSGTGINHDHTSRRLLRQEREPEYLETGAVYVMRTSGLLKHKSRFFGQTSLYVMPAERRWEIDEPIDLRLAELLMGEQTERLELTISAAEPKVAEASP